MLFHIDKITFEEKAPRREALENILGTFRDNGRGDLRFIYLILGSCSRVDFYFGIARDTNCDVYDIAQDMLAPSIKGNFHGSNIKLVDGDEKQVIFDRLHNVNFCGMLEGVPGVDKDASDKHFQHITLVEEAHRLLSRYTPGDSLNKRQGVEVFSDMLAEVRKYGESLIIVDQIPEKMTPEVLKNTNTKIVHKLFAKDDKDVIGNTMALEEDQKDFLSNLDTGKAIVFTQGWTKAVQVKIKSLQADDDEDISTAQIEQIAVEYYKDNYRRGVLRGLERVPQEMTDTLVQKYLWLKRSDQSLEAYGKFINCSGEEYGEKLFLSLQGKINKSLAKIGGDSELLQTYIYYNYYDVYSDDEEEKLRRDSFAEAMNLILAGDYDETAFYELKDILRLNQQIEEEN